MVAPICRNWIKPTPTMIFVNQSDTCSRLVFGTKVPSCVAASGTPSDRDLGTPNKKPTKAPTAAAANAARIEIAIFDGLRPVYISTPARATPLHTAPAVRRPLENRICRTRSFPSLPPNQVEGRNVLLRGCETPPCKSLDIAKPPLATSGQQPTTDWTEPH